MATSGGSRNLPETVLTDMPIARVCEPPSSTRHQSRITTHAIHVAVLTELASAGYQGLTMEAVARRARTGKAALYRRWASKQDLVLDALLDVLPEPAQVELSGSVRDNLSRRAARNDRRPGGRGGQL